MKRRSIFILGLLILFFNNPGLASPPADHLYANNLQEDSIFLVVKQKMLKKSIGIYWNNFYVEKPILLEEDSKKKNRVIATFNEYLLVINTVHSKKGFDMGVTSAFLVYPGETLSLSTNKKGDVQLAVDNDSIRTNELNFFVDMAKEVGEYQGFYSEYSPMSLATNIRIKREDSIYSRRIDFLKNYKRKTPIGARFEEYATASFYYKRFTSIVFPYYSPYKENKKDSDSLIDNVVIDDFKINETYFYMSEYRTAALFYTGALTRMANNKTDLYSIFETGMAKLDKNTRDIVLFDIIRLANKEKHDSLSTMVKKYVSVVQNNYLENYVSANYQNVNEQSQLNKVANVATSELISMDDKKSLTWKEVLSSDNSQLTYVDFWASWCVPCRAEMPRSRELREKYIGKKVRFLYVSIDENIVPWKRASKQLGLPDADSYLLAKGNQSLLAKELNLTSIPRYVIVNNEGKIIHKEAPGPGDPKVEKFLID